MRYLISVSMFFFIIINTTRAQRITLIPKDERIQMYQEQLVKYLIEKQQLEKYQSTFQMKYYENKIYVTKCLEFYKGFSNWLLLVKFGNLDDHGWICWGLLGLNQINLFLNTKGEEFKKLSDGNQTVVTSTVKAYVDVMDD